MCSQATCSLMAPAMLRWIKNSAWPASWRLAHDDIGLESWSLRFASPAMEASFVSSSVERLANALFQWAVVVAVLLMLAIFFKRRDPQMYPTHAAFAHSVVTDEAVYVLEACSILLAIAMKLPYQRLGLANMRMHSPHCLWLCEVLAVLCVLIALMLTLSTDPWYTAKLMGRDAAAMFSSPDRWVLHSDAQVLLTVDIYITISHILLPVRLCVMWPVGIAGLGLYVACACYLGSAEPPEMIKRNIFMLVGLVISAWLGKRKTELQERRAFCMLIAEKVLQCETEFRLSNIEANTETDTDVDATSMPTITHTGEHFSGLTGDILQRKLSRIVDVGKREHWLLDEDALQILPQHVLGSGSFGTVVRGLLCGSPVAVKVPFHNRSEHTVQYLAELANEVRVLRHVRHNNIVLFHGACIDPSRQAFALVIELVDGVRLDVYINNHAPPALARYSILQDICCALRYMHERSPSIVHGDLKATNVMTEQITSPRPRAKLLDFGLSTILTRNDPRLGGTIAWMAPELLLARNVHPNASADVFSFGRLIYVVMTGRQPLAGLSRRRIIASARKVRLPSLAWEESSQTNILGRQLAEQCSAYHASRRPHMKQIMGVLSTWSSLCMDLAIGLGEGGSPEQRAEHSAEEALVLPWQEGLLSFGGGKSKIRTSMSKSAMAGLDKTVIGFLGRGESKPKKLPTVVEHNTTSREFDVVHLTYPELLVTPIKTQMLMVLHTAMRWNCPVGESCCFYHVLVQTLQQVCDKMATRGCNHNQLTSYKQCPGCMALDAYEDSELLPCDVCGRVPSSRNIPL